MSLLSLTWIAACQLWWRCTSTDSLTSFAVAYMSVAFEVGCNLAAISAICSFCIQLLLSYKDYIISYDSILVYVYLWILIMYNQWVSVYCDDKWASKFIFSKISSALPLRPTWDTEMAALQIGWDNHKLFEELIRRINNDKSSKRFLVNQKTRWNL